MSRSAVRPALVVVALLGAAWPASPRAQSREIRLPPLEVPDEVAKARRALQGADRSALLGQSIELSDERDRRTLARERTAWGRLSGTLCSGCGAAPHTGRIATIDPIAVLNARRVSTLAAAKPTTTRLLTVAASAEAPAPPRHGSVRVARPAAILATAEPVAAQAAAARPAPAKPVAARPVTARVAAGPTGPSTKPAHRRLALMKRTVRPTHSHRVQLAHRRAHRSKLTSYLGRVRYAFLRWRHQRPHHLHRVRP